MIPCMQHFRTAEDYRDHLPCEMCGPTAPPWNLSKPSLEEVAPKPKLDTQALIREECDAVRELLLAKNLSYGDSAINPMRLMSKASPIEQILVRIDDKLNRLISGKASGEDVELDLIGYLVLLRVARRVHGPQGGKP